MAVAVTAHPSGPVGGCTTAAGPCQEPRAARTPHRAHADAVASHTHSNTPTCATHTRTCPVRARTRRVRSDSAWRVGGHASMAGRTTPSIPPHAATGALTAGAPLSETNGQKRNKKTIPQH